MGGTSYKQLDRKLFYYWNVLRTQFIWEFMKLDVSYWHIFKKIVPAVIMEDGFDNDSDNELDVALLFSYQLAHV